ncbi:tetratricopeptide repeat protein [Carnobacterium sp.]|uniref:tetratricopeptide repeat protein n=1 Tax=Carnobacterium sp. TaxID=48221 RepID=UPI002FCC8BC1
MGEKIIFPKNYEQYVKKAVAAFQLGRMEESLPYFKEAYQLKQEEKINTFYATALYQVGRYQEAKEVVEDQLAFYEKENQLYAFYVSILIRSHYFLQAEAIIKKQLMRKGNDSEKITWQSLLGFSKEEQKNKQVSQEKKIADIGKRVLSMMDKSYQEQSDLMKEMDTIPFQSYLKLAKLLLQNPFVSGLIKATIIERLVNEQLDEAIEIIWFDQARIIRPKELTSIEENATVRQVQQLLEEKIGLNDPTLFASVSQEAQLHFIFLYPFIEEVITSPETWVELYRQQYELDYIGQIEKSPHFDDLKLWQNRLNELISELMS